MVAGSLRIHAVLGTHWPAYERVHLGPGPL